MSTPTDLAATVRDALENPDRTMRETHILDRQRKEHPSIAALAELERLAADRDAANEFAWKYKDQALAAEAEVTVSSTTADVGRILFLLRWVPDWNEANAARASLHRLVDELEQHRDAREEIVKIVQASGREQMSDRVAQSIISALAAGPSKEGEAT